MATAIPDKGRTHDGHVRVAAAALLEDGAAVGALAVLVIVPFEVTFGVGMFMSGLAAIVVITAWHFLRPSAPTVGGSENG